MKMEGVKAILALFVLAMLTAITIAAPYGPDAISRDNDDRRTTFDGGEQTEDAQAGNVTQLTVNTTTLTKRWQGYYGNISGTITLDDGSGYTMYDWSADGTLSPVGEIYAANESVSSWTEVKCVNVSSDGKGYDCDGEGEWCLNLTSIEDGFGISSSDTDGVDETFSGSTHSIVVGERILSDCSVTRMYVNNASQSTDWNETLLTINNTKSTLIFAAQAEQNANGFNNKTWDFEMIVLDDGDDDAATTYYFYVELT